MHNAIAVVDAPRQLVFDAWIDPDQLLQWQGPHGFTNPVHEIDARVGGAYRIVMRGANGTDYPVKGVYREILAPLRPETRQHRYRSCALESSPAGIRY